MSVAAWRIRKRVKALQDEVQFAEEVTFIERIIGIIDEESEAEAERQFTQRINPDPVTDIARDLAVARQKKEGA